MKMSCGNKNLFDSDDGSSDRDFKKVKTELQDSTTMHELKHHDDYESERTLPFTEIMLKSQDLEKIKKEPVDGDDFDSESAGIKQENTEHEEKVSACAFNLPNVNYKSQCVDVLCKEDIMKNDEDSSSDTVSSYPGQEKIDKFYPCEREADYFSGSTCIYKNDEAQNLNKNDTILRPYSCDGSGKLFTIKRKLVKHMYVHNVKAHSCDECGRSFADKCTLSRHMAVHTGVKPYSCSQCGKSFTQKQSLNRHANIHAGVKPYSCNICSKSFGVKTKLIRHMHIHTGIKPFSCDQCGKSFVERQHLNRHINIHTGLKPYSCDQCNKAFTRKEILDSHIFTHTALKPFSCDLCGRSFIQKKQIHKHMRLHNIV